MGNQADSTDVETMLRSVLSTEKHGFTLDRLEREYAMLIGTNIPWRQLGFKNVEHMIQNMPQVARIERGPKGVIVKAVADETMSHVAQMVAEQKSSKSKPAARPPRRPAPRPSVRFQGFQNNMQRGPFSKSGSHFRSTVRATNQVPSNMHQKPQGGTAGRKPGPRNVLPPRFQKLHSRAAAEGNSYSVSSPLLPTPPSVSTFPQAEPGLPSTYSLRSPILTTPPVVQLPSSPSPFSRQPLSPVFTVAPKKERTFHQIIDNYAKKNGIQHSYNTIQAKESKRGPLVWYSTLKLNLTPSRSFNSYPEAKMSKEEAEEEASRKAVLELGLQEDNAQRYPVTPVTTEEERNRLMSNVNKIVLAKPNGIWTESLPALYESEHQETLPENWLDLLEKAKLFTVNEMKEGKCIIYPFVTQIGTNQNGIGSLNHDGYAEVRSSDSESSSISGSIPDSLQHPEGPVWDVFITFVTSPTDVSFRFVDFSGDLDELRSAMETYYSSHDASVNSSELECGALFAVQIDETWHRVQVLKVEEDDKALCYFVDHGDVDNVNINQLQVLDQKFLNLPFQAVQCQLDTLQEYENDTNLYKLLVEYLPGKTLVAYVINREEPFTVTLYDTSTDQDINLNSLIYKELLTPKLPGVGIIVKAYLCHVTPDGDLFVNIVGPGIDRLNEYMELLHKHFETLPEPAKSLSESKLYACQYGMDGSWYRAIVLNTVPDENGLVPVKYVDYGNEEKVPSENIYEIEFFGENLTRLPYQAVRCRLKDIPLDPNSQWTEEASERLMALAPDTLELLLKVVSPSTEDSPAYVELFKRIEPNNELVSINATLAVATDVFKQIPGQDSNNNRGKHRRVPVAPLNRPLSQNSTERKLSSPAPDVSFENAMTRKQQLECNIPNDNLLDPCDDINQLPSLEPPDIPPVGSYFDVHITVAATPHNFTCQPYINNAQLEHLMQEMQVFYGIDENCCDLHESLLQVGAFYVGKHTDDLWYRICIRNIDQQSMLLVYFVDYGDYSMMHWQDLQPLYRQFRKLPYQAVHASLAGVEPLNGDWNPMDCLEFRRLVAEKEFVSIIKNKEPDSSTGLKSEKIVVTLIDTSDPNQDVYIHQVLSEKKIVKMK